MLDGVDDPAEVHRRIVRLVSAKSEAEERARLAEFIHPPMFRHSVIIDDVREELADMFGGFVNMDGPSDELLERWRGRPYEGLEATVRRAGERFT